MLACNHCSSIEGSGWPRNDWGSPSAAIHAGMVQPSQWGENSTLPQVKMCITMMTLEESVAGLPPPYQSEGGQPPVPGGESVSTVHWEEGDEPGHPVCRCSWSCATSGLAMGCTVSSHQQCSHTTDTTHISWKQMPGVDVVQPGSQGAKQAPVINMHLGEECPAQHLLPGHQVQMPWVFLVWPVKISGTVVVPLALPGWDQD